MYDRLDKYTPNQIYEITKTMTPDFSPGTAWKYSNGNYNILGMMVEKVTGNQLEDEIITRIIIPLGLNNTIFP
ncbi:MAG: beta-lactamase family protein [Ignavibacteria bacterium]|nr:beta-lactamase family protein [Ignavibacteria bacterium]